MNTSLRFLLAASVAALAAAPSVAALGKIPDPVSYTRALNGDLVFVMLGDPDSEAKTKEAAEFQVLRRKYPRSGLYRGEALVWALDGPFAPSDAVFLSSDGRHLVRLDGPWWREKDFSGQKRLPDDAVEKQLAGPAVSFFLNGRLLKTHTLKDLVTRPEKLPHSPEYVLWVAGAVLNEDTGRFVLFVQDSVKWTFDATTGEVVSRDAVGLANPLFQRILLAVAGLGAAILAAWAYLAFVRWRKPDVTSVPAPSSSA